MQHSRQRSILIVFSFVILIFCICAGQKATGDPAAFTSADLTMEDPWSEEVFKSRKFHNLVVSLCVSEEDLYAQDSGLLTDGSMLRGRDGEHPVRIFVYEPDGTPLIAQDAGIRLNGASSRTAIRKSFRIIARKEYVRSHPVFTCDLWGGRRVLDGSGADIREYSSFILHSVRLSMDATGIHNSVGYSLARSAGIEDAAPTTPAAVYLNGVYQGAYFLMPAKNDHALAELYHIQNPDDIQVVSVFDEEKTGFQSEPEVLAEYLSFVDFLHTCQMTDPDAVAEIEQQLDVEQCLEYYAVNLLLGNGDWLDNNLRVWRCRNNGLPCQDGKWRFFLFDLDWIGSFPDLVSENFRQATTNGACYNILPKLLENPDYQQQFRGIIARMERDAFYPERIEAVFAEEEERMFQEAAYDFQSEAFDSYLLYSSQSSPLTPEDYLTLEDRRFLIEDFKGHLLKTPGIINECLDAWSP